MNEVSEQDLNKKIVGAILTRRQNPTLRSSLRFGDSTTLWVRAIPQIAELYADKNYLREPLLLFGAAAARGNSLKQGELRLGQLVAKLVRSQVISESSAEDRLTRMVAQELPGAHRQIRSFLAMAESAPSRMSLDWFHLWSLYRAWNLPKRRISVLEDYYQTLSIKTTPPKDEK